MNHIAIVDTENPHQQIEVTHHNYDAEKGHWRKHNICRNNFKINFFMEGDFSIFVNDVRYRPIFGDICVFPPRQIHCGQVESQTHLDYFQLDVGVRALDCIPGGSALLAELLESCGGDRFFLRPKSEDERRIRKLCYLLEAAVAKNNKALAFAYVIEILACIKEIYAYSDDISNIALSETTKAIVDHIKKHYDDKITISLLSGKLGFSGAYLSSLFKKEIGMSIHDYLTEYRVMRSAEYLETHSIADTCYYCGFYDASHYISIFKKYFGCTPAAYKKYLDEKKELALAGKTVPIYINVNSSKNGFMVKLRNIFDGSLKNKTMRI